LRLTMFSSHYSMYEPTFPRFVGSRDSGRGLVLGLAELVASLGVLPNASA
jgi:hypothetical protein